MKKPDELLVEVERSIFGRALLLSLILHAALLGGTSLQLFQDWKVYGVHSPSYINAEKTKARKAEEDARRKAEAEAKAAAEAAKAEAVKAAAESNRVAKASAPAAAKKADAAKAPAGSAAAEAADKKVTPPEVEPLPPKKEFQYGEDLSLD